MCLEKDDTEIIVMPCVVSSKHQVSKPLIEEYLRKLCYLSLVVFQLENKFICDRSTH